MHLEPQDIQIVTNILKNLPDMSTAESRNNLLFTTGLGKYINLNLNGSAQDVSTSLIRKTDTYGTIPNGKHALLVLLEYMQAKVGIERQEQIEIIINKFTTSSPYLKEEQGELYNKPFPDHIPFDIKNNKELDLYNNIIDDLFEKLSISDLHSAINRSSGSNSIDNIINSNHPKTQQIQQAVTFYIQRNLLGRFLNAVRHNSINPVALSVATVIKIWNTKLGINTTIHVKKATVEEEITISTLKKKLEDNFDKDALVNFIYYNCSSIYNNIPNIDSQSKSTIIRLFLDKCPKAKYKEVSEKIDNNI